MMEFVVLTNAAIKSKVIINLRNLAWVGKAVARDPKLITTESVVFINGVLPPNNIIIVEESVEMVDMAIRAATRGHVLTNSFGRSDT